MADTAGAMAHAEILVDDALPVSAALPEALPAHDDAGMWVRHRGRTLHVAFADIRVIEARGNYALLFTAAGKFMIRETMAALEGRLTQRGFARVHRSVIVNMSYLKGVVPRGAGDHVAVLVDGTRLRFGRLYYARLRGRKE
jgi:two-component system LytT family response regulator